MAAAAVDGDAGGDVGDAVEDLVQHLGELHVHRVPPPVNRPVAQPVDTRGRPLVYLDLETTGLGMVTESVRTAIAGRYIYTQTCCPVECWIY